MICSWGSNIQAFVKILLILKYWFKCNLTGGAGYLNWGSRDLEENSVNVLNLVRLELELFIENLWPHGLLTHVQTHLRDIVGSVSDHCNKVNH